MHMFRDISTAFTFHSPESSVKLNITTEIAITRDCPASSPLTPAKMLIALVQKTANIPM